MPSGLTRNHYIVLLVMTFILFPIVLISLPFLPDLVPLHFTIDLSNDTSEFTWGSKYKLLLIPLPVVATGTVMIGLTWYLNRRALAAGKDNRAAVRMFYLSVAIKAVLIAVLLWLLSASFV